MVFDERLEGTSKSIGGLDANTTYYWKVVALSDAQCLVGIEKWNHDGVQQFTTGEATGSTY